MQYIAILEQNVKVTEAETAKQVAIKNAEGLAQAKEIDAKAEAGAVKLIQEQISQSPVYIDYLNAQANITRSENWNPTTMVIGSSTDLLMDITK